MSLGMRHIWVGTEVGSCSMLGDGARETVLRLLHLGDDGEIMGGGGGVERGFK